MSSQSSLPHVPATSSTTPVYTLTVYIRRIESKVIARCGNLELPEESAATVREALKAIVTSAKKMLETEESVTWKTAPVTPKDNESQFRVPIHL